MNAGQECYSLISVQSIDRCFFFIGWTGDLCDIDQNGCIDPGCPIGTNCTDIPAPGTGAICSDCPIGSELDGAKCSGNALVDKLYI